MADILKRGTHHYINYPYLAWLFLAHNLLFNPRSYFCSGKKQLIFKCVHVHAHTRACVCVRVSCLWRWQDLVYFTYVWLWTHWGLSVLVGIRQNIMKPVFTFYHLHIQNSGREWGVEYSVSFEPQRGEVRAKVSKNDMVQYFVLTCCVMDKRMSFIMEGV